MKKLAAITVAFLVVLSTSLAWAYVTVRYQNKDSQSYEWDATCGGSTKVAKFKASTTSSFTIQGSAPCTVHTPNGDVQLSGGEKIRIKNATITIQ